MTEPEKVIEEIDDDDMFEDEDIDQELLVEDEDDDFLEEESVLERLAALVDIVPPTTRQKIVNTIGDTVSLSWGIGQTIGSGLWVLCTGALLILLPVGLELERDAMAIQQEYQQRGVQAAQE
jgi:import receptor subunit TOM22